MMTNSNFFDRVYEVARLIPAGRVTSYGAIANYLGTGRSARMVGWAMNASAGKKEFIPAHRVVNRKGVLTGKNFFGTSDTMADLLRCEGLEVVDDQIIDFEKYFWDPAREIGVIEE